MWNLQLRRLHLTSSVTRYVNKKVGHFPKVTQKVATAVFVLTSRTANEFATLSK